MTESLWYYTWDLVKGTKQPGQKNLSVYNSALRVLGRDIYAYERDYDEDLMLDLIKVARKFLAKHDSNGVYDGDFGKLRTARSDVDASIQIYIDRRASEAARERWGW